MDLTEEIARERGIEVDRQGFDLAMAEQRQRAREAGRAVTSAPEGVTAAWSEIRTVFGPTHFLGYQEASVESRILAVVPSSVDKSFANIDGESGARRCGADRGLPRPDALLCRGRWPGW